MTVAATRRLGISPAVVRTELARGRWQRLARGVVLTRPDPPSRSDWSVAGLAVAGRHAALSGWDAARVFGLGAIEAPAVPVLVLAPHGRTRDLAGAHVRRVDAPMASQLVSVADERLPLARIVAAPRAVIDTALTAPSLGSVQALMARAVQRDVCSVEQLTAELARARRRDSARARQALAELAQGVRSAAEATAVRRLLRAPVPPFELNVPIVSASGQLLAVADVLWRELLAVLEVDGREFHFYADDWQATMRRHNRLTSGGVTVTHYPPSRIAAGDEWLHEVVRWLTRRAVEFGVPFRGEPRVVPCRDGSPRSLALP